MQDADTNLVGTVKLSGNMGTATGKHVFMPGLFFESRAKHPFVAQEKRDIPVDVQYPKVEQDEVTYYLPAGFSVEGPPQDANLSWPDHALMKIHAATKDNAVTVNRTLAYNYTLLDPKEYKDLHDFYQKVATADEQQLVLSRAPSAKGN